VVGLLPSTTYTLVLNVAGRTMLSDTVQYTTDTLPTFIKGQVLTLAQGTLGSGFTLLAPLNVHDTADAVAFDSIGRVRWYRIFRTGTS